MPKKLPILVSVPHGGTRIPSEIHAKHILTKRDIFWDSDGFTCQIYQASDLVFAYVETDIARAALDLNRAEDDLPPKNPDGIVKQKTCLGVSLYPNDALPSKEDTAILIEKYYRPYHSSLRRLTEQATLALDCHSMLSEGPAIGPDPGGKRPLFCLSNRDGQTCAPELLARVRTIFAQAFDLSENDVQLNAPFKGGYITRTYGANPCPWIQVEMSRDLYLAPQWFDEKTLQIDPSRLGELNQMFRNALSRIAAMFLTMA